MSELLRILTAGKMVSERDIVEARAIQQFAGGDIGAALVRLGALSEDALLHAIGTSCDLPVAAADMLPDHASVLLAVERLGVPLGWLIQQGVLPWFSATAAGETLYVAGPRVFEMSVQEAAEHWHGGPVRFMLAPAAVVEALLGGVAGSRTGVDEAESDAERLHELAEEAPVISLVQTMFAEAIAAHASDIHLEPFEDRTTIRFRIDGILSTWRTLPRASSDAVTSRIKLLSQMDIAERRLPQDGRQSIRVSGQEVDLRVSALPTIWGESIVLRFMGKMHNLPTLAALGLGDDDSARLTRMIERPDGLLVVTGPTGSGKTTTVYRLLSHLNDGRRKILTIEDPVEIDLPGILQIGVRADIGLTFAAGLRSILRQDPDVIFVGEIRDGETARIAVQAALTGHQVITTVHTSSAVGAVTRLIDLGVEDFLLSEVLNGLVAQRLVRRACEACAGIGCKACSGTGFAGRIGAFELVAATPALREAIRARAGIAALTEVARSDGSRSLRDDALAKVARGLTTSGEALRVLGTAP